MMKTAYLESSAINHAHRQGLDGRELRRRLESLGYAPAVGLHAVYELARTFLDANDWGTGQALFQIVRDLKPAYKPGTWKLLTQEVLKLRTGAAVLPFLDPLNNASVSSEVSRMAAGIFDIHAKNFIQARETEVRSGSQAQAALYLEHVARIRSKNPAAVRAIRTFEAVVNHFEPDLPKIIKEVLRQHIDTFEAKELAASLTRFPALRTTVRVNLYLTFIAIRYGNAAARDKVDDYRHVIEASYCDAIVTCDSQLASTVVRLNPDLQAITCDRL